MTTEELKQRYAQEPWGKLLIEMGREPYDTESSARRVAEYAANRIAKLESALKQLAECRLTDENCASLEVASKRVRNIARAALSNANVVAAPPEPQ